MGKPWHWTYETPDGNVQLMMDSETARVINSVLLDGETRGVGAEADAVSPQGSDAASIPLSDSLSINPLDGDEVCSGPADERFRDPAFVENHLASRSETVRGVAAYLAQRPGRWIASEPIALALNLEYGWNSLAGALGAAGLYFKNRSIGAPWHSMYETSNHRVLLMMDAETAEVIKSVLEQRQMSRRRPGRGAGAEHHSRAIRMA
ncbi:MAG: hypothetical protein ACRDLN_04320 [Solirubrobacteraceae bacterium]